jgi:arabinogalactan oligomer / maltooligosaccharide transport system permease protein
MRTQSSRKVLANTAIYIILSVMSVVWLLPIAWLVLNSLRGEPGAYTPYVLPKTYTLNNYVKLFTETGLFSYPRWFLNTFIVAIFTCAISTVLVLMTSYSLSRLRFRARRGIMNIALILGMFPGFMSMIAVYFILKAMGLSQTLTALVLVYSGGAALGGSYYIAKGFFDTIPRVLDEAAVIDGASQNMIFWKVILPLSRPVVIYTALVSFMVPWVDFIFVSVIMKDNYNNCTIALGLYQIISRENLYDYFTRFCAGAVLIAIPITILFIIMQRFYVSGVTGGAVKG